MAEELTDEELIAELKRFGDNVKVPIDRKKRPILVKKLNHYRAREKAATQPKKTTTTRRKQPAEFSSEESGDEIASSPVSRVYNRSSISNNSTPYYSNTETIEISPPRTRQTTRNRKSLVSVSTTRSKPKTPSLYPDLSDIRDADVLDHSVAGTCKDGSPGTEFGDGEFTDSDPEESIYVENKSMNTTFNLHDTGENNETNMSFRTPSGSRSRPRTALRNRLGETPNQSVVSDYSMYNHSKFSSLKEEKCSKDNHIDNKESFKTPKASCISTGILIVLGIFFIAVASAYIYISSTHEIDTVYPANIKNFEESKWEDTKQKIKNIAVEYEDMLKTRPGNDPSMMLRTAMEEKLSKEYNEELKGLAMELIVLNPHWNIRVYTDEKETTQNATQVAYLETDSDLGLLMRLKMSILKVLFGFLLLLGCLLFVVLGIIVLRYRNRKLEEEQRRVFNLVEKIIEVIKENYELHQEDSRRPPYMAVSHVRDQLLPLKERQKLRPLWDKAVQFIEANESRIRIETQAIQGEDFLVWRWLPVCDPENFSSLDSDTFSMCSSYILDSPSNANGGKVWQGPAFGENSALPYGPTPCLKIRNMFDADVETGKDWEVSVEDALLEKCKLINGIVHIYVDPESKEGCVYMKCNSCDTAFMVYKSVHGWWFDGRLVTVKYLRADNYHNKFPESRRATKSLKPSNSSMSSMAQPYHRSTLEMT